MISKEVREVRKIRKRISYGRFKNFLKNTKTEMCDVTIPDLLHAGHALVESYRGFHYFHASMEVQESVNLIIDEYYLDKAKASRKEMLLLVGHKFYFPAIQTEFNELLKGAVLQK